MMADQKLLSEAEQLELMTSVIPSPLQVFSWVRSSCESLLEETLVKLGVEMFNCQTDGSSKECTSDIQTCGTPHSE
ncbi:protein brambleberry-like isoform X2 [Nothobranchius furzeri]|uniref:protein brambleberry-like isoform X2 n=1 Tax=Nothobranchius furzeri TaxID=105023 RepID=UPI0039049ED5